jgi:hypothetical protein
MKIEVSVKDPTPVPAPVPGVFTTKKYGNPLMVELMGLDTVGLGTSNFQNVDLFDPDLGAGFGGVSKWQMLGRSQMDYLIGIQPKDRPLGPKMAFLTSNKDATPNHTPDRPYWTTGADWNGSWSTFRFGTIVFGGQKVKVKTNSYGEPIEYKFYSKFQGTASKEIITFYELDGMRWADRDKVTHQTHPYWIQRCTWAGYPDNAYRDTWDSGIVYHPVWSPTDFPSNYGNKLYIAKVFLE